MHYHGTQQDIEQSSIKKGVLLINLGTPRRPVCPSLRGYLAEFLMDPRVIEIPKLLRLLLVRGIIVNFRSHKSAASYRKVWTEEGSPLMVNSVRLTSRVAELLAETNFDVELAMRYGEPSIDSKLKLLHASGIREIVLIPLYPQYSGSTGGSTFDAIANSLRRFRWVPKLHFIDSYYRHPLYINAIANSVESHWRKNTQAQKLIMTFHGVPQKFISRGDPYYQQCQTTAQLLATKLKLNDDQWMLVFQSRLGTEAWLQPYCDESLKALPKQGVTSVDIICPGFSVDCLETLEEIDGENREYFMQAGGQHYSYIPCLNDSQQHAELLSSIVHESCS